MVLLNVDGVGFFVNLLVSFVTLTMGAVFFGSFGSLLPCTAPMRVFRTAMAAQCGVLGVAAVVQWSVP